MHRSVLERAARILAGVRRAGREAVASGVAAALSDVRGLAGFAVRAAAIVRHAGGALLFAGVAAAILCALGQLGIPLVVAAFFLGVGAAATVGKRTYEDTFLLLGVGTLVLTCALPCVGAVLVGARLADGHGADHYLAAWALFLGLTFLGTFVLVPLLEAAPRLVLARRGLGAALSAALIATGRRGLVRTLVTATIATSAVALVPLLDALGPVRLIGFSVPDGSLLEALAIGGGGGALSWAVLLVIGGALATEPAEPRRRSRSAFSFVVVGIVLLLGATIVGAAMIPAPPGRASADLTRRTRSPTAVDSRLDIVVEHGSPTGPGLLVVRHLGNVTTTVPVAAGRYVEHVARRPHRTYAIVLGLSSDADPERLVVRIDEEGHRLDDGPRDRIWAHVGGAAAATLSLSLVLIALAVFRTRHRARLHAAVRRGTESVVTGRLRSADGQEARVGAGVACVEGWRLDAADGSCIVALPSRLPILGGAPDGTVTDGQEIELVAPEPMRGLAFREGATPAPRGAALVVPGSGRLDELVGTWALAPAGVLLAAASVAAVAGTILTLGGANAVQDFVPWLADAESVSVPGALPAALDADDAADRERRVNASAHVGSIVVVSATETRITAAFRHELTRLLPDRAQVGPLCSLHGVTAGSVLDLLGFEEGDRIVAVAGIPVSEPNRLRQLLEANRHAGALAVRVVRRDLVLDLVFGVQDPS